MYYNFNIKHTPLSMTSASNTSRGPRSTSILPSSYMRRGFPGSIDIDAMFSACALEVPLQPTLHVLQFQYKTHSFINDLRIEHKSWSQKHINPTVVVHATGLPRVDRYRCDVFSLRAGSKKYLKNGIFQFSTRPVCKFNLPKPKCR
jgi:hypothetical protein